MTAWDFSLVSVEKSICYFGSKYTSELGFQKNKAPSLMGFASSWDTECSS